MNFKLLKNVQIISALIWAVTIVACGWIIKDATLTTILLTASGFHVVMMSNYCNAKKGRID